LNPCFSIETVYLPTWTRSKAYVPLLLVSVVNETPVASLVSVTKAPGIAAPFAS
jgi:hypothetical protein